MEKTGDFRDGESRSDLDMTKVATNLGDQFLGNYYVLGADEKIKDAPKLKAPPEGIGITIANIEGAKRVNFKE